MIEKYDIAIIGLGPAGAILARHLRKDFRVVAIDKKVSDGGQGFQKPCGGLLAPDAQKALSRFNMALPKDILVSPQIFSVRTIDVKSGLIRHYQRFYINLNRHKFDQWLVGQIPETVEIHNNARCTKIIREDGGYLVEFKSNSGTKTVWAKYIAGADGAASVVRKSLFKDCRMHKYLSIQQWFKDFHGTPFYSCIFDPSVTDSYAWGLTKDDSFIFGGAFPVKTGKQNFEALKEKMKAYGFRLENPIKTEACFVLRPKGINGFCHGGNGAFLIGEAAGFISPSSLEGISYAIDSGYALAQCLNNAKNPDKEYRKKTRKIRFRLFCKRLKRPFMYTSFTRKLIMKSGLSSVQVLSEPE